MALYKVPIAMSSFWRDFNNSKLLRDFTLTDEKPYIKVDDDPRIFFCEGDFNQPKLLMFAYKLIKLIKAHNIIGALFWRDFYQSKPFSIA
eukprot:Pgem_evm1s12716